MGKSVDIKLQIRELSTFALFFGKHIFTIYCRRNESGLNFRFRILTELYALLTKRINCRGGTEVCSYQNYGTIKYAGKIKLVK